MSIVDNFQPHETNVENSLHYSIESSKAKGRHVPSPCTISQQKQWSPRVARFPNFSTRLLDPLLYLYLLKTEKRMQSKVIGMIFSLL